MSKDQKRYRQLNIVESFAITKKKRANVPTMEQNLRDLMASAAEARLGLDKTSNASLKAVSSDADSVQKNTLESCSNEPGVAGKSSNAKSQVELPIPESEGICFPSSAELFPSDTPDLEQYSSQESVTNIIESLSCSSQSPEIFSEDDDSEIEEDALEEQAQLSFLNRIPACSIPLPKLEPLENHSIMFSPHIRPGDAPRPYPSTYRDKWDFDHVRMPCSTNNKYPVMDLNGENQIKSRWDLICKSLRRPIHTSQDLENAIMQYNSQYRAKWNFYGLHAFLNQVLSDSEREHFFERILPPMIGMALCLPEICTQPIPLLKKGKDHSVTMSQKQIGCLLLNAFFCTFPRRNFQGRNPKLRWNNEYASYPDINFNRLFSGIKNRVSRNAEKLKCLISYFRRMSTTEPCGTVTFHRQFLQELPRWHKSMRGLRSVVVKSDGLIENEGHGLLQVDFANKFVGGGVLGHGCVQEEIRFLICPELMVSRLFVECLGPTEVLIVTGIEQYNDYSGYSDSFKWEGNFKDQTPRDDWGRRCTQVVAMDATHFTNTAEQFKPSCIERELNKAYCGFYENALPSNLSAVATGNWGCGAFNGNPTLKFIIQAMAASQAGRDILYFTFGNKKLRKELKNLYNIMTEKNLNVGDLWRILLDYCNRVATTKQNCPQIYNFFCSMFSDQDDEDKIIDDSLETGITSSDIRAAEKLVEAVNGDSSTELEDNDCQNEAPSQDMCPAVS